MPQTKPQFDKNPSFFRHLLVCGLWLRQRRLIVFVWGQSGCWLCVVVLGKRVDLARLVRLTLPILAQSLRVSLNRQVSLIFQFVCLSLKHGQDETSLIVGHVCTVDAHLLLVSKKRRKFIDILDLNIWLRLLLTILLNPVWNQLILKS